MADSNFKVKNGLTVGEDKLVIDAATGIITTPDGTTITNGEIRAATSGYAVIGDQAEDNYFYVDDTTTEAHAGSSTWLFNNDGTTSFPNYTFPSADGSANQILKTNGTGTLSWYSPSDANTTYDFNATSTTGGANLNLVGSDSTTDTVKLTNGNHITATYTSGTEITLGSDATDANTISTIVSRDSNGDFSARTITLAGDLAVNGADITTTAIGTATIFNTNATTLNIGGAATTMSIGNASGTVTIPGNLTVDGTTTTINTQDLLVEDKNITIGNVAVPTDVTAAGGGITLLGATNKTITWNNSTDGWEFNQPIKVTGDAVLSGDLTVTGNDIKGSGGTAITLNAITGFSPNTSVTGNLVRGSIRDATTLAAGDAFSYISGAANTLRGLSIDNTDNTAKRPGVVLRAYNNNRPMLVSELNRGTVASPLAVASGNNLLEIAASGWNGTQWVTDAITAAPISISLQAAEAWTSPAGVNTANGARLRVDAQPIGVTGTAVSRSAIINHIPTTATYRADAWTFATREVAAGGTNTTQLTLDSSGNAVLTGDLAVNGGDITTTQTTATLFNTTATTLNVGQAATAVSLGATTGTTTVRNATTLLSGALNVRNGLTYNMLATTTGGGLNELTLTKSDATAGNQLAVINFVTQRSTAGTYTPTLSGDILGQFKFNGNVSSTTTPSFGGGPAGGVFVAATENWAVGAIGSRIVFQATKNGTTTPIEVISASPTTSTLKTDALTLQDSSAVNLTGNNITYNRVYGQWQNLNTIVPAADNTAYAFALPTTDFNNIATVNTTSRIVPGAAGMYKLQFSVQIRNDDSAAEHIAYFWWRRNGTDVTGSMGRVGIPKAAGAGDALTIAGWDNMISSANTTDYWELMYAVDDATHVDFPTFAATAFGPSTASMFVTLVPIGA